MEKLFRGIALFLGIAYVLCGCGVQHIENSATVGVEMADVTEPGRMLGLAETSAAESDTESVIGLIPASASDTEPALTPSPVPTPAALPASPVYLIEYGERMTSISVLPSTEDYEKYLAEDLCCHEAYKDSEDGAEYWDFDICLPQFGENMPCYRELNAYFEELYAQLLLVKEHFYDRVKEVGENISRNWDEDYSYWGMTIGEQYLTVYVMNTGYSGGIRDNVYPMPVTFDLTTGEPVTLLEILNCSEPEIKELVADYVYGYFLSQGEEYVRRNTYLCFEPQDFYMLEQGLGVYYPRYAIECGAAGDFLFVIPYEDLYAKVSAQAFPTPKPPSPVTEIDYGELSTVMYSLPSSEGYEAYLAEDVTYHDAYQVEEGGREQGVFDICLPRFNESLPCHEQINAYFTNWSADALDAKEAYYARIQAKGEREDRNDNSYRKLYYEGMTIGERYLTVYTVWMSHDYGNLDDVNPVPVTFDLTTGEPVTLPEILGCSEQETAVLVDECVYGYCCNQGIYSWGDVLWFEPEQFYMLEQGLGVYYRTYTIDLREHLFIIPYGELSGT